MFSGIRPSSSAMEPHYGPGDARGITAFIVPRDAPGLTVEFFWWTLNMPTDHARISLTVAIIPSCTSSRMMGSRSIVDIGALRPVVTW